MMIVRVSAVVCVLILAIVIPVSVWPRPVVGIIPTGTVPVCKVLRLAAPLAPAGPVLPISIIITELFLISSWSDKDDQYKSFVEQTSGLHQTSKGEPPAALTRVV